MSHSPEFEPSTSLVQELFSDSNKITIQLSPLRAPSLEEEGRVERLKESVSQGLGRLLSVKGKRMALDKVPFAIVSENDVFTNEYAQEICTYFALSPFTPALRKLCTEFRHYVENNRIDAQWGRLTVDSGRVILEAPPAKEQLLRSQPPCKVL